jgi:hypothetical protein
LPNREVTELSAPPGRGLDERNRQAIDLRPVLGIQEHPVDRQFVEILIGAPATRPGERDDVVVVGGVGGRAREVLGPRRIAPAIRSVLFSATGSGAAAILLITSVLPFDLRHFDQV